MAGPAVSVLTVTWNRAHVLERVYNSLNRQGERNFEWVVVDDGSTDNTSDLVKHWAHEAEFPIIYYRYDNNRGQTPALNTGRTFVSGDYTLRLDSDDALLDDAMETISCWRRETGVDAMPEVCGLAFRCVDESGRLVGSMGGRESLPKEVLRITNREARYCHGMTFDFTRVMKTCRFREQAFGELTGSENVPPVLYWNALSDHYDTIFIDHAVRRYFRNDGERRLSDRAPGKTVKWPRGNYLRALGILNDDIGYLRRDPKVFLNAARKISRLGLHVGRPLRAQLGDLEHGRARLLWAAALPGGVAGYVRDRMKGRRALAANPDRAAWGPAAPPENAVLYPPPARFAGRYAGRAAVPDTGSAPCQRR